MIEIPISFAIYVKELKKQLDIDPATFVPNRSYVYQNKPFSEKTPEQKQKIYASTRKWQKKNPKRIQEYAAKWKRENPEKAKAINKKSTRKYYLAHKEEICARHKQRYQERKRLTSLQ